MSMPRSRILLPLPLVAVLLTAPHFATPAGAEVRRCEAGDGTAVFTDRRCTAVGATAAATPTGGSGARLHRSGCARTVQDLMFEVSMAIDARDANHLASVYHWAGMSGRSANAVMDRLGRLVRRPLVDVVPVMAQPLTRHAVLVDEPALSGPSDDQDTDAAALAPGATRYASYGGFDRRPPVGLRIVQTTDDGITPSETSFQLQEHFGCVWLRG